MQDASASGAVRRPAFITYIKRGKMCKFADGVTETLEQWIL